VSRCPTTGIPGQFCTCVRCQKPANAKAGPVAAGTVRPPSRIERLLEIANGDESKEQTHAARRVLAKRGIDWRTER
jgi:hypothetical protein